VRAAHDSIEMGMARKASENAFSQGTQGPTRFPTKAQAARLLLELPEHLQAMAGFALCTGLRQGNVKRMRWTHVDLIRRVAWVDAEEAKAGKALTVPLDDLALAILCKCWGRHPEYVFTYEGRPINQVGTKAWRSALKRAGIDDFHCTIYVTPSRPGTLKATRRC
jgi:integrase